MSARPDGKHIAQECMDGTVEIIGISHLRPNRFELLSVHTDQAFKHTTSTLLCYTNDGSYFAICGAKNVAIYRVTENGYFLHKLLSSFSYLEVTCAVFGLLLYG